MVKDQRRAGGAALALTILIVFSDVAVRSERAAAGPFERSGVASETAPESLRTATFHTFDIEEVFSNADGSVQFIELRESEGVDGNFNFAGNIMTTTANGYVYPNDLPDTMTANRFVLCATASFVALPGAVSPDYIIPQRFFEILGDTISILQLPSNVSVDTFTFGGTLLLPTDGSFSLNRDGTTGVNSPTNFAGETGSVIASPPVPALSPSSLVVMTLALFSAAIVIAHARRPRSVHRKSSSNAPL